jgi:hypothetical protein
MSPTMGRAAEPVFDDMAVRDLDRNGIMPHEADTELAASGALALDIGVQAESFPDRATLDELVPGAIVPNESAPDELA